MKQLKIGHAVRRFCVSVGTLLVAANGWAATWYVNGTSGANGNSGLAATSAKATIQAAIDAASADIGCYEYQDTSSETVPWPSWVIGSWSGTGTGYDEDDGTFPISIKLQMAESGSTCTITDDEESSTYSLDGLKIASQTSSRCVATGLFGNDEDGFFNGTFTFNKTGPSQFKAELADDPSDGTISGTMTKDGGADPTPVSPTVIASAVDADVSYDGEGHGISVYVTTPASGATVEYARTKDGPWQSDAILFTNVCAATKVWYRALADGYVGVTNAATVTVNPRAISSATIALSLPEAGYKYDGTAKTPTVSVTDTLAGFSSSDYTIAYADNVNAGTAKVIVTGVGNYGGTAEVTFAIAPRELTFTSADAEWAWDGAAHSCETTPAVSGDGFVGADGVTFSDFASVTAPGSYKNTFAYAFTAGTVASNYAVTQVYGTLLVHNYRATVKADGTMRIDGLGGEALGSTELVIPETIDGIPVTEVKEGAFVNSACGMTTLKLAKYCKKIGASAFRGVKTLQRVTFVKVYETDGVTEAKLEIGAYAFGSTGVSSLVVPDDVQEIGDYAFSNCGSLTRVSVGPGTTVSPKAFYRSGITAGKKPEVLTLGAFVYDGATATATMTVKGSGGSIDLSGLRILCWTSLDAEPTELAYRVGETVLTESGCEVTVTVDVPVGATSAFFRAELVD